MQEFDLYNDIATRTNGDIYIGVVGPVRTGKSTFISKFMETMVIPNIDNKNVRARAIDELPQSADGRTIMTTEPKFIPEQAIDISVNSVNAKVKMIDCVGYLVPSALGHKEADKPRFVATPWSESEIPFEKAGEIGTNKVITEHSTIGILVTTDGSITDIEREDYVTAEEKVVNELKSIGKPFVIVLNTANINSEKTNALKEELTQKYNVRVIPKDVKNFTEQDGEDILEAILEEFPLKVIDAILPKWLYALDGSNQIIKNISTELMGIAENVHAIKDYKLLNDCFKNDEYLSPAESVSVNMGNGVATIKLNAKPELFYKVVSDELDKNIENDYEMLSYVKTLKEAEKQYSQFKGALESVEATGYGIVTPCVSELTLQEPEICNHNGKYGVKLKATAPALHIMKVDVETEVNPMVGTEEQGEELKNYLTTEFENNKDGIWNTNIFGKSLLSLVNEGLTAKINSVPEDITGKMRKTMSRIVNEGKGGVICILL